MTIKEIMDFRHTIKTYDSTKKIDNIEFKEILELIRWTPSSFNFQLVRNIVVNRESELNKKIANQESMMFNFKVAQQASKLQFFITPNDDIKINADHHLFREGVRYGAFQKTGRSSSEITNEEIDKASPRIESAFNPTGMTSMGVWATKQAYIQIGYATIGAANKKIDTTIMGGIHHQVLKKIFIEEGLMTEEEQIVVALAYGYREKNTSFNPSERKPLSWYTKEIK